MFQNGIKITNSALLWRKQGLKEPVRLYSSVCLHCKAGGQNTKLSRLLPRRDYASAPDRVKKSHPIRNTLALLGVTTGAVVAYAKFDSDFRKQVEDVSPGFNEFIKIVTAEERSYEESYNIVSNYVTSLYTDLLGEPTPTESPKKPVSIAQPKAIAKTDVSKAESGKSVVAPPPSPPPTAKPPAKEKAPPAQRPVALTNIDDQIRTAVNGALLSLQDAVKEVKSYSDEVGKVLSNQADNQDSRVWSAIRAKTANKDKLVNAAERGVTEATEKLKSIRVAVESGDLSPSEKERVRNLISSATSQLQSARNDLDLQRSKGSVTERYWQRVEDARRHFQGEIEALFPNANIADKKLELKGAAEVDLFLLHVFEHVLFYQRELARIENISEQKVRQALSASGEAVSDQLIQVKVDQAVEKERRRLHEELQRKLLAERVEQEKELSRQLKLQLETAEDHMKDLINTHESDLDRRVTRKLDQRDTAERVAYENKVATMLSQLKALELVLGERIEADRNAHQAHVLFSACQSLFRALRSGVAGDHWTKQLRPLDPEISAVSNAVGGKDPLVATVLSSVPAEARTRGVYPETALRERFLRVEQVARRVALVPETGGSLLRYLVSYIQSSLLFPPSPIPPKELKDDVVDVAKLDTFDLLHRARYWVDRGDLKMTLRYMNLLQGASRAVASQWMDEARIYLETQLVVNTLMAHAAATGMLYL